ncbi:transforming growth factor beta activator LRRC32-like [Betta splendens]|uniref:Transforming growth factor beta activator LRRC32-like n=1 Tax=Betta splendens TaxID=158456 RepID=A0A6P7NTF2_BETSP|nr:transforming growth factor beta activator LRRC32-like [Betta splendens]
MLYSYTAAEAAAAAAAAQGMVKDMFSSLLLLWPLSYGLALTHAAPQEQSWNNHNLHSVPRDLDARVRRLDLSNNFIRQLRTLVLPSLEQLDLSANQLDFISEGAFEELARLERLNLSRNAMNTNVGSNSKALRSISGLRSLDLSANGLTDEAVELYLRNKSSLDWLKMTGNALTRLSRSMFRESKGLRIITIDDNLISFIEEGTFEPLSQLKKLNLARNTLVRVCNFKLHQVKYLNLSRNSLESFVTREDEQMYELEILDLSFNNLLYFPVVPKMNRLRYLHLQNNMVGTLDSEASMVSEANYLYSHIMNENTVRKNILHSNWRLMPLVFLDLSYNHFRQFPAETLSLLSSLQVLNFSHNCLQNITWNIRPFHSHPENPRQLYFPSLKHLDLQSNGLTHLSPPFLKALTQIETLNLKDNTVQLCTSMDHLRGFPSVGPQDSNTSCFAFGKLETLKHLNLEGNNIKTLHPNTFQKSSLVSLNLARNTHMVMHEGALEAVRTTLQSLIVSGNNMSSSDLTLPCMPALTQLKMSGNHLDVLPSSLGCSPLTQLDIRNNALHTLNHSLIKALSVHLKHMYISRNHFNCCDSKWLILLNDSQLADIGDAECFTSTRNLTLTEYLKTPMSHCTKVQDVHIGQTFIIALFVFVIIAAFTVFCKKLCCTDTTFVVR